MDEPMVGRCGAEVMTLDVLVAEMLALGPVEAMAPSERSAESLALLLARAAERVHTDPETNIADAAVRAAARVLADRLAEHFPAFPDAATGPVVTP